MTSRGRVLGIETSCDETAAAVVDRGRTVVSSIVSSQVDLHARYGGVVPELAGRAHVELTLPVVTDALAAAGLDRRGRSFEEPEGPLGIDAVAATVGPGLIGALLVGVSTAKALALAWGVPFVGVNHLEGHLYAAMLEAPELEVPVVVLLVSGGHTLLVALDAPGCYRVLGATVDDAAGEAFDKVARYLGLGYPGGPEIDRLAASGRPDVDPLPAGDHGRGLRLLVLRAQDGRRELRPRPPGGDERRRGRLVPGGGGRRARRQVPRRGGRDRGPRRLPGRGSGGQLVACGHVSPRPSPTGACMSYLPSRAMCTDNAAMIAAAGYFQLERSGPTPLDAGAVPDLQLHSSK